MSKRRVIIIGGGPAGLTAACELVKNEDFLPIVLEQSGQLGGISKTYNHNGNRIDLGGHRFFSKSDVVMKWWQSILPLQSAESFQASPREVAHKDEIDAGDLPANGPDPEQDDQVMLLRRRISRIFFLRKFFDYPISLSPATIRGLGFIRIMKVGFSYLRARLFPIRKETSLEDFFINRFGRELYQTFFKDYTEKVWGVSCSDIDPEWGAQRIKGLSVTKTILHAVKKIFTRDTSLSQKDVETSLIERFLYPKYGPGQIWEEAGRRVTESGGEIRMHQNVTGVHTENGRIVSVDVTDTETGESRVVEGDFFVSSMPVQTLVSGLDVEVPQNVREVAGGLMYRDFITVGLLLKDMKIKNETDIPTRNRLIPDTWIYIQEQDVKLGRLQVFNNWSPYMVKDPDKIWLGLEYFCNEGDELWSKSDDEFIRFATGELAHIGFIAPEDVLDSVILRMPKTYPAYFGTYNRFDEVRSYLDGFENLFLVGRNGMHRYNNQDHSMLTAIMAAQMIAGGQTDKGKLWEINTEQEYHEEKVD